VPATWTCSAPVTPPSTCSRSVHSRADGQSALRPRGYHPPKSRSARVVSHHLDGFLRFTSRGLVASRCRSWVPRVSAPWRPTEGRRARCFPAKQDSYPSKNSPPIAAPRRRGRCPLAVLPRPPPRLARSVAGVRLLRREGRRRRLRGLAPSSGLVSLRTVAGVGRPVPSWASFLSKVLPDGRRSPLPPSRSVTPAPEEACAPESSALHPLPAPAAEAEVWSSGHAHAANRANGGTAPEGPVPGAAKARDPKTAAARSARWVVPAEAVPSHRLETGVAHAEACAIGTRSRPNPFERSPPVRVHCTADRAGEPVDRERRLRRQACEADGPMCSKSIRS